MTVRVIGVLFVNTISASPMRAIAACSSSRGVPVSYTHLDVYKRQGEHHLDGAQQYQAETDHPREAARTQTNFCGGERRRKYERSDSKYKGSDRG